MYIHEQISAFSTGLSACSMSQGIGCFNMEGPTIINSNGDQLINLTVYIFLRGILRLLRFMRWMEEFCSVNLVIFE
jgi:hypothetical protein